MLLIVPRQLAWLRIATALVLFGLLLGGGPAARAQSQPGSMSAGSGPITWRVCVPPPVCFVSPAARQAWARQNGCRFLEDVCDKTPPDRDRQGARPADQSFWGNLWSEVSGALVYGYEFVKGAVAGLQEQVSDLWALVTHPGEVVGGLVQLGRAFFDDPRGTLATLATLLGQEAADTVAQATQCGAYDLGKVIGEHVNPAVALKLATRLTRYGERLDVAVGALRHELGCASFAAGTPVLTPDGWVPIERVTVGTKVLSRHERSFADTPRTVSNVFSRVAPDHRLLRTEAGTLRLTDEHPLWVQGKGWTEAKDVTDEDVIAGRAGDALVLSNEAVAEPLPVHNFSVTGTESYFVGAEGLWAHNARCRVVAVATELPDGRSAADFKDSLRDLPPGERVARVREMARWVAASRDWRKDARLSQINQRDVYVGNDGFLYAVDTQHGTFEKAHAGTGRHQGEFRMTLEQLDPADPSRRHDLRVR